LTPPSTPAWPGFDIGSITPAFVTIENSLMKVFVV
jgi:hypothetical protein